MDKYHLMVKFETFSLADISSI